MSTQEFLYLVERKFFYLFTKFGFHVKYSKDIRLDHNIIGLESNSCRMLFSQERGGFGIFIGGKDTSFDDNKKGWVNLYSLIPFLLKREIDWTILDNIPYSMQTDMVFSIIAKEFAPLCDQITKMFDSPDVINQWRPAFDQYVKEKVHRRLEKK